MPDWITASTNPSRHVESRSSLRVVLAAPRGFCAGVRRAIATVEDALDHYGPPIYVRRAIVHNLTVVRSLEARGAVFIQELGEAPEGAVVILSAHGVASSVRVDAERRGLRYIDAVCPLVAKVHREVSRHHGAGRHVVLIGHAGHPEIEGTLGQIPTEAATLVSSADEVAALDLPPDADLAYATQTTYSVDEAAEVIAALRERFPRIAAPSGSDICYATTNRQGAVRQMALEVDAIIVAGETFSSNACRLAEVAKACGCPSVQLVAQSSQIDWTVLEGCESLGITAAASTPESTVSDILDRLSERFDVVVEQLGNPDENAVFKPVRIDDHAPAA